MGIERTFEVPVDGVGTFTFRRRTTALQIRLEAEEGRILGGPTDNLNLRRAAHALATLTVLTSDSPDGWNVDDLDPLNQDTSDLIFKVYGGLREAEEKFRSGAKA